MLMENQIEYRAAHLDEDLGGFDLLILTGNRTLTGESAKAVRAFVDGGGKAILIGESALLADGSLALDVGADYAGPANFRMDYTLAGEALRQAVPELPDGPVRNYDPTPRIVPNAAEVLAEVYEPLFGPHAQPLHEPPEHALRRRPRRARGGDEARQRRPDRQPDRRDVPGARRPRPPQPVEAAMKVLASSRRCKSTAWAASAASPSRGRRARTATWSPPLRQPDPARPHARDRGHARDAQRRGVASNRPPVKAVRLPLSDQTLEHAESDGRVRFTVPSLTCHALATVEYA